MGRGERPDAAVAPLTPGDYLLLVSASPVRVSDSTGHGVAIDFDARTDFWTWPHEIGHGLGMVHAFPDNGFPDVAAAFDNSNFTVMTYREGLGPPPP